ncbi:hypothetical protein BDP67DRAFT_257750 [Colletotrichum lupini]|nr:hypothetical protein BDP67DRAFT_257750 [Colletotrichum lupini]
MLQASSIFLQKRKQTIWVDWLVSLVHLLCLFTTGDIHLSRDTGPVCVTETQEMAGSHSPQPTTPLANVAGVDAAVQTVASPPTAASSPAVTSEPVATSRVTVSSGPADTSEATVSSETAETAEPTATSEPVATPTPTSPLAVQNSPPGTAATPTANTPGLIEASDDGASTDGSTIDERITNYSASLTSSVVDYPVEYGRRYHAFRPGCECVFGASLFTAWSNSHGVFSLLLPKR